jgi:hypothetical protein
MTDSPDPPVRRGGGLDARMRMALVAVALTGGVETVCAAAFVDLSAAFSVALGAALAVGNLWALARIVVALLPGDADVAQSQSRVGWAILAAVKMVGLLGVSWLLMRHGVVGPLGMLVGFLALPIGIAIGSLVSDRSAPPDDR